MPVLDSDALQIGTGFRHKRWDLPVREDQSTPKEAGAERAQASSPAGPGPTLGPFSGFVVRSENSREWLGWLRCCAVDRHSQISSAGRECARARAGRRHDRLPASGSACFEKALEARPDGALLALAHPSEYGSGEAQKAVRLQVPCPVHARALRHRIECQRPSDVHLR